MKFWFNIMMFSSGKIYFPLFSFDRYIFNDYIGKIELLINKYKNDADKCLYIEILREIMTTTNDLINYMDYMNELDFIKQELINSILTLNLSYQELISLSEYMQFKNDIFELIRTISDFLPQVKDFSEKLIKKNQTIFEDNLISICEFTI